MSSYIKRFSNAFLIFTLCVCNYAMAGLESDYFVYKGGFRLSLDTFGESKGAYSNGTMAVSSARNSLFFVGANKDQAIAEFPMPTVLSASLNLADLPVIKPDLQAYSKVLSRLSNPQGINRITGMEVVGNSLYVNAVEYYDAPADNTNTTLIVDNAFDIANSSIKGFYNFSARAHAAGWISKVPSNLVSSLGGDYISGFSDHLPISSRASIGPSAFTYNIGDVSTAAPTVATTKLLDFDLNNMLAIDDDRHNTGGTNDLWTSQSAARYGFIVPGTNDYMVIGSSGGHVGGVGYKIVQDNGTKCGGHCTYLAADYYNHIWLWDTDKLYQSKTGAIASDIKPYKYGIINIPFESNGAGNKPNLITGADYDATTGKLYILMGQADPLQSSSTKAPIVLVFELKQGGEFVSPPAEPSGLSVEVSSSTGG